MGDTSECAAGAGAGGREEDGAAAAEAHAGGPGVAPASRGPQQARSQGPHPGCQLPMALLGAREFS